jgi:cytochrome P450
MKPVTDGRPWLSTTRTLLLVRPRLRPGRGRRDAGAVLRKLARGHQDAVGLRIRDRHILLLLEPELVAKMLAGHAGDSVKGPGLQASRQLLGNGLLTSEGGEHRRARRLVAPAFSRRRLAGYTEAFARCTQLRQQRWSDGERVDMQAEMQALTLQIVGRTLLGIDVDHDVANARGALEAVLAQVGTASLARGLMRRRSEEPATQLGADALHALVDDIIERRRASVTADRGDVVSALLAASGEPDGLRPDEVHDHVITLLMAGHETTATALTWTMYLLGSHPEVQAMVHAEVDALHGRIPTFEDVATLSYTRAVISEAIRLYPPAWIIGRATTRDFSLGGWDVPAGSLVAASPLLLHRDPRWFPEPDSFDPSRWLDQRREAVPRHGYLPFGTGPRACIGEQFAWTEAVCVLAGIAQNWRVEMDPGVQVQPEYRVTMRPSGAVPMRLRAR